MGCLRRRAGRGHTEGTLLSAAAIGNLGYFADRPIADQLGKVDPVIARGEPRLDRWLIPGHSKWDLDHNVGELRPTVVTQLFAGEDADVELLERLGYQRLGPAIVPRTRRGVCARSARPSGRPGVLNQLRVADRGMTGALGRFPSRTDRGRHVRRAASWPDSSW